MQYSSEAPRDRIIKTVALAVAPYLDSEMRTPTGLLPYSLRDADRNYDTFNPAAYMAGQLQRFSRIIENDNPQFSKKLQDAADSTMLSLINNHRRSPETGSWYWKYSIQENISNDLPHASYIADGIKTYVLFRGNLAEQFDLIRIYEHIAEFYDNVTHTVRAWPRFENKVSTPARLYDLSMGMYLSCTEPTIYNLRPIFVNSIPNYSTSTGSYTKYPYNYENNSLVINEYEAYLFRSLAVCSMP